MTVQHALQSGHTFTVLNMKYKLNQLHCNYYLQMETMLHTRVWLPYLSLDKALALPVARDCYTLQEGQHVAVTDELSSCVLAPDLCRTA